MTNPRQRTIPTTITQRGVSFPCTGEATVFSVHEHAANLRAAGSDELVTLTVEPTAMTVSSVLLAPGVTFPGFRALGLGPGDRATIRQGRIELGGAIVIATGDSRKMAPSFDGAIGPWLLPGRPGGRDESQGSTGPAAPASASALLAAISLVGGESGFGALAAPLDALCHGRTPVAPSDPFARAAWERIDPATRHDAASAQVVAGLIGLGQGFTPSGDDFAVGYLAARALLGAPRIDRLAAERFHARLATTTVPGATIVRQALGGAFPAYLCRFARAFTTSATDAAVAEAARHGHSSGIDSLTGLAFGLHTVPDSAA